MDGLRPFALGVRSPAPQQHGVETVEREGEHNFSTHRTPLSPYPIHPVGFFSLANGTARTSLCPQVLQTLTTRELLLKTVSRGRVTERGSVGGHHVSSTRGSVHCHSTQIERLDHDQEAETKT